MKRFLTILGLVAQFSAVAGTVGGSINPKVGLIAGAIGTIAASLGKSLLEFKQVQ